MTFFKAKRQRASKRFASLFVTGSMIAFFSLGEARAQADASAALTNDQIIIRYAEPGSSHLKPLQQKLMRWRYLEQLKEFLSPLRLPEGQKLRITMKECGSVNSWWSGRVDGLFLCYDFFDFAERAAPLEMNEDGMSRIDAILGAMLQVTFHELGHGLFDIYDIPVFGREEDAADQISGFIVSQFGPKMTRRTLPGAAYLWKSFAAVEPAWSRLTYSDEHGHPLQRAYNYLCIAYGANPEEFQKEVDNGLLPKSRAENCAREYRQIQNSFVKTILPHVDREKMNVVRARQWLLPPAEPAN